MGCCPKISHAAVKAKIGNAGRAAHTTYQQSAKAKAKITAKNKARAKALNAGPLPKIPPPPTTRPPKAKPQRARGCTDCTRR